MIKKEQALFPWIRHKLRRLSYMWPERKYTKVNARVSRGKYVCSHCLIEGLDVLWGPKDISLDHVNPVVPVTIDSDSEYILKLINTPKTLDILKCRESELKDMMRAFIFITRLFCKADGFQVLCHEHHDLKTLEENELRKIIKEENKKT